MRTLRELSRVWGVRQGFAAYAARLFSKDENTVKAIYVGMKDDVFIRPRSSDWSVMYQVFIQNEYRISSNGHLSALRGYYDAIVASGETPIIVDCGANIGLASIWYSDCFPKAKIFAIEPEPGNFAILEKNAAGRPNIIPVKAGVLDRNAKVMLSNPGQGAWAWETKESTGGGIDTVTIPELLSTLPGAKLLVVKIDIEGSETELFRSNTEWVEEAPLIVFETHDLGFNWRGTAHAVFRELTKSPRDYLQIGENTFAFSHGHLRSQAA